MKVGDKLYRLVLWEDYGRHKFEVRTHTITKINKKTVEVWGCYFKINKSVIGYKYFTSKKKMYAYHLKQHKEYIKPTLRVIKKLERKLKSCQK